MNADREGLNEVLTELLFYDIWLHIVLIKSAMTHLLYTAHTGEYHY